MTFLQMYKKKQSDCRLVQEGQKDFFFGGGGGTDDFEWRPTCAKCAVICQEFFYFQ